MQHSISTFNVVITIFLVEKDSLKRRGVSATQTC